MSTPLLRCSLRRAVVVLPRTRPRRELLELAVAWASMHSTDSLDDAATITDRCFLEESLPIAGPGAPLIAEFSITEFAVAVGLSTEAGKAYLGEAVELRYRLPRVWKRVAGGDLVAWKATVDRQGHPVALDGGRSVRGCPGRGVCAPAPRQ